MVLTPQFVSQDQEQLTKELQQHVKSVTAPYKYPRKVREGRCLLLSCALRPRVWEGGRAKLKQPTKLAFSSAEEAIWLMGGVEPTELDGTSILCPKP